MRDDGCPDHWEWEECMKGGCAYYTTLTYAEKVMKDFIENPPKGPHPYMPECTGPLLCTCGDKTP